MSRRAVFDYPITCPAIDRAISQAQAALATLMAELLDEACPLLPSDRQQEIATEWAQRVYREIEDGFETVRRTNDDMRHAAERQIDDLTDTVNGLEVEVSGLKEYQL